MNKILLLLLLTLVACSSEPYAISFDNNQAQKNTKQKTIYVVSHGWHTSLIIPARHIQPKLPELQKRFAAAHYLEFGWGDRGFYQASGITTALVLKALFIASDSIIHVAAIPNNVTAYFKGSAVEKICVNSNQLDSITQFIANSFAKDWSQKIISSDKGLYGNSQFYQAIGDYYLMNTCNKWTAKGLQSAGLDISPMFKLTADSVMDTIRQLNLTSDISEKNCSVSN